MSRYSVQTVDGERRNIFDRKLGVVTVFNVAGDAAALCESMNAEQAAADRGHAAKCAADRAVALAVLGERKWLTNAR